MSDLRALTSRCSPEIELIIADLPWPAEAAKSLPAMTDIDLIDSVQSLGSCETIAATATKFATDNGTSADVVVLAVSSASFTLTAAARQRPLGSGNSAL